MFKPRSELYYNIGYPQTSGDEFFNVEISFEGPGVDYSR
jgi:hypothetical protein